MNDYQKNYALRLQAASSDECRGIYKDYKSGIFSFESAAILIEKLQPMFIAKSEKGIHINGTFFKNDEEGLKRFFYQVFDTDGFLPDDIRAAVRG